MELMTSLDDVNVLNLSWKIHGYDDKDDDDNEKKEEEEEEGK